MVKDSLARRQTICNQLSLKRRSKYIHKIYLKIMKHYLWKKIFITVRVLLFWTSEYSNDSHFMLNNIQKQWWQNIYLGWGIRPLRSLYHFWFYRERNFKEIGSLLTDINFQHCYMKYNKHIVDLPDEMVENIGKSILKKKYREEINGEEVPIIDTKLNTLFLKLNDTVDNLCKIRNILLPYAKEPLGNISIGRRIQ